jgi:hypothetical protein
VGLPIDENPNFSSSLMTLELKRIEGSPGAFGLMYEVEIRNRTTGGFAVLRGRDLSEDVQSHLHELMAMVEQHAGERFFSTQKQK